MSDIDYYNPTTDSFYWHDLFLKIKNWVHAAKVFSNISSEDYASYLSRKPLKIKDEDTKSVIVRYGAVMGHLLQWIAAAIPKHNENFRTPSSFRINTSADIQKFENAWKKHVQQDIQSLKELGEVLNKIEEDIMSKQENCEDAESFSSYSDYSEEETDSEEDDDEEKKWLKKNSYRIQ